MKIFDKIKSALTYENKYPTTITQMFQRQTEYGELCQINNKWYMCTLNNLGIEIDSGDDDNSYLSILNLVSLKGWELAQIISYKPGDIKILIKREIWV